MTTTHTRIVWQEPASDSRFAAVTALGVAGVVVVQGLIDLIFRLVSWVKFSMSPLGTFGIDEGDFLSVLMESFLMQWLVMLASALAGSYVSLRFIAPIERWRGPVRAAARGIVAALVVAAAFFVITVLIAVAGAGAETSVYFALMDTPLNALLFAVEGAIQGFAMDAPLLALAGVLLWIWLQRHPLGSQQSEPPVAV